MRPVHGLQVCHKHGGKQAAAKRNGAVRWEAERLAGRLRKVGIVATATSGSVHAEIALYEREPGAKAIGISNPKGPCPACKTYFGNTPNGFANVYWDTEGWIF